MLAANGDSAVQFTKKNQSNNNQKPSVELSGRPFLPVLKPLTHIGSFHPHDNP